MQARYAIALSAMGGMVIGGAAVQTIHAQAKPPVYMIAMNELKDAEGYKTKYLPIAQKTIKEHGGVYVAAGPGKPIDGKLPKGRVVILKWESMDALLKWRHSPEYEKARKFGEKFANYNVTAVDGVQPK